MSEVDAPDAIVVGAGPAGAITAWSLARRGASVLLLDRQAFPRWKVCGACVSPGALSALASVGLHERVVARAVPLGRLRIVARRRSAGVALRGTVALSRPALDGALVEAAVAQGAVFRAGARASLGAVPGDRREVVVRVEGEERVYAAAVVVDATGLGGALGPHDASAPGDGPARAAPDSRLGLGATFDDPGYDLAPGELRMVVGRVGYVGLVRVEDGGLNVGAAVDARALRGSGPAGAVADILAEAGQPPLEGEPVHPWRGTPALTRGPADVGAHRLFRVGDAAGYVEPFTGEGMCWALGSGLAVGELAAAAIDGWRPELVGAWRAWQARRLARSQRLCRAVARGLRRPRLVHGVVGALAVAPGLADPFVRIAAGRPRAGLVGAA